MAEKLDPTTNLPEKPKSNPSLDAIFERGLKSKTSVGAGTSSLDTKELLAKQDISPTIQATEHDDPFEVQTIFKDELSRDTEWDKLFDKSKDRFAQARTARMEQLDEEQGALQVAQFGMQKFAGKTLNRTVLGLAGTVYGLGKALFTMDADAIMDNAVFDASDYLNEQMEQAMPIYTDEDKYHEKGFFDKMMYHPGKLFYDEVGDGVSFAASAVAQELLFTAITGATFGTGSGIQAAGTARLAKQGAGLFEKYKDAHKIVKAMRGIDKTSDAAKVLTKLAQDSKEIQQIQQFQALAGTARGLAMSSNYEASMEARGAEEEMRAALTEEFKSLNDGAEPQGEDLKQIEAAVDASKWSVWGGNMAILGASNMLQFSKVFWKGYQGQRAIQRNLGKELVKDNLKKYRPKFTDDGVLTNAGKYAYNILKNPTTEAMEEASQGILTQGSTDYWARQYSFDDNKHTIGFIEAQGRAMQNFIPSPEGSTSMGIGFLIGALGVPVGGRGAVKAATGKDKSFAFAGGVMQDVRDFKDKRQNIQKLADDLNSSPGAIASMKHNYENFVRNASIQSDLDQAVESGDMFAYKNAEHDQFYSYVRARVKAGMYDLVDADLKAMKAMDLATFNKEFGGKEVAEFDQERKDMVIAQAQAQARRINELSEHVEKITDNNKVNRELAEQIQEVLIHSASTMENTEQREAQLAERLSEISGMNAATILEVTDRAKTSKYLDPLYNILKKERSGKELSKVEKSDKAELAKRLKIKKADLQALVDHPEGIQYDDLRGKVGVSKVTEEGQLALTQKEFIKAANVEMQKWEESNPAQAAIFKPEAEEIFKDIAKLKNRREEFIEYYNYLLTPKGAQQFSDMKAEAEKVLAKKIYDEAEAKAKKDAEEATTQEELDDARDKASQVSKDVEDSVNNTINDNVNGKKKSVRAYDPANIQDSLKERYEGNPALLEQEGKELVAAIDVVLGKSYIGYSTPEELALGIYGTSNTDVWDIVSPIVDAFYEQAANEVIDEREVETVEHDDIEIVGDEIGASSMVLGSQSEISDSKNSMKSEGIQYERKEGKFTNEKAKNYLNIDWDFVNNPLNLTRGTEIKLEVDTDTFDQDYYRDLKEKGRLNEGLPVQLVTYDADGKRHVVGGLAAYDRAVQHKSNEAANESMKTIREAILKTIEGKTGVVDTGFSTKVKLKDGGRVHIDKNITSKAEHHSVSETLQEGEELIFGIGINMVDATVISVPNRPDIAVKDVDGITAGAVYAIKKSANGRHIPVRVSTRKVNEEELNEVRSLLNEINNLDPEQGATKADVFAIKDKIREIVYLDVMPDIGGSGKFKVISFVNGKNVESHPLEIDEVLEFAKDKYAQVSKKKINTENYNEEIDGNKVTTNLSVESTTHSASFVMEPIEVKPPVKLKDSKTDNAKKDKKNVSGIFNKNPLSKVEELDESVENESQEWADEAASVADKTPARITFKKEQKAPTKKRPVRTRKKPKFKFSTGKKNIWDKAKSLTWLQKNVPNVPVHIVEDVSKVADTGGELAWGVFQNAAIYIANNAGKGTAYHEAFHAIFNLYLSPEQQQAILIEAQGRYGLNDDLALEEALADDFADYVASNVPKTGLKAATSRFFKKIWNFIKQLTGKNAKDINSLFHAINNGYYSSAKMAGVMNQAPSMVPAKFKKVAGMNPTQKKARIDMINSIVLDQIADMKYDNPKLSDNEIMEKISIGELYHSTTNPDGVLGVLQSRHDEVKEQLAKNPNDEFLQYKDEQLTITRNNFFKGLDSKGNVKMGSLYLDAVRALRQYGIVTNLTETELEENISLDEADTFESYHVGRASVSTKDTTTYKVKSFLSTMKATVLEKGELVSDVDDIGEEKMLDFDEVFNSLKYTLTEHYSSEEMIDTLNKLVKFKPHYADIITEMQTDSEFKSAFFHTMSTQRVDYVTLLKEVKRKERGEAINHKIFDSNRSNPSLTLMGEWNSSFIFKSINAKGEVSEQAKKNATKVREYLKTKMRFFEHTQATELDTKTSQEMSTKLQSIGMNITPKELRSMFVGTEDNEAFINFTSKFSGPTGLMNTVINSIIKGNNPYAISTTNETKALTPFIDTIIDSRPAIYEQSMINVEGKRVFANVAPNYVSRLITQLKGKKYKDTIKFFKQDKFYRRNLWLNELGKSKENRDLLNRKVLDGYKVKGEDRGTKYTKMSNFERKVTELEMYLNGGNKDWGYYTMPILADAPQMNLVSFKKYNKEEILNQLYQVALQEAERNTWINESGQSIENFTDGFYYFKGLDGIAVGKASNKAKVMGIIKQNLKDEIKATTKQLTSMGIMHELEAMSVFKKGMSTYLGKNATPTEFVEDYVNNAYLANIQMLQLFSGDTAFYKSDADLSKRNKQITNPGNLLDVSEMTSRTYNTIYLRDDEQESSFKEGYAKALEGVTNSINILSQYDKVNATDAQAYISLERYEDVMRGAGLWTDKHTEALPHLKAGTATQEQLNLVLQPIKPFYYGKTLIGGKVVPVQNKNSEFLLLPQMIKEGDVKLQKIMDLFDSGISSVQFESAVKVGGHHILDLDTVFSEDSDAKQIATDNAIVLNNSDYRIQLSVPEHHIDTDILFGTQIRKLIMANLGNKDHKYTIGGKEMNADDVLKTFNELIGLDLKEEYDKLEELFKPGNLSKLVDTIREEVLDRGLAQKYIDALEIDEATGKTKFPLYFPSVAKRNEAVLTSLFKNRVTKQRVKGGSFVQVSDFGFSKKLNVVFGEVHDREGNKRTYVKEMEALLPWWSKQYFPTDANGEVDITKIPEELRELVGFRIPTEDKYSMPVIKVVGFTPKEAGGVAILPADITARAGTDFDIDKLFIMMPEFNVETQNNQLYKKVKEEFEDYDLSYEEFKKIKNTKAHLLAEEDSEIKEAIDEYLHDYQSISRIENGKDSKKARDNYKLDIVKGILQSPLHAEEVLTPGGFDIFKDLKSEINILRGVDSGSVKMHLPSSQLELFSRNMNGADLIGIFANHNTNHSMLQHSDIALTNPIKFNGKERTQLNGEFTEGPNYNQRISRVLAEFLASSVDNAKDPVLTDLNVNVFTADIVATIIRAGHDAQTAMLFVNQPIIRDFTERFINGGAREYSINTLVKEMTEEQVAKGANDKYKGVANIFIEDRIVKGYPVEGMRTAITKGEKANPTGQLLALNAFLEYRDQSKSVANMVASMRADSIGAGPTMSANEVFITKYKNAVLDKAFVEDTVSNFFSSSTYSMLGDFTNLGILKPNNLLQRYFPWMNKSFKAVKDSLGEGKMSDLTEKELEHINYSLLTYIGSKYEFFNLSREDKEFMLYGFPKAFMEIVENDTYLKEENIFTKNLNVETVETEETQEGEEALSRLKFNNTSKLSEVQKQEIEEAFEHLLENPKYKDLGEQLIKYSFASSGFNFTPHSFNHLVPISFYDNLVDSNNVTFQDFLTEMIDGQKDNENAFMDFRQTFYRNNFKRYDFTPTIEDTDYVSGDLKLDYDGKPLSLVVDSSVATASKLFKRKGKKVIFKPVIKHNAMGKKHLMMLNTALSTDTKAVYYILPEAGKPGYLNEIIEPGEDRSSVVKDNVITFRFKVKDKDGKPVILPVPWASGKISNLFALMDKYGILEDIHSPEDFKAVAETPVVAASPSQLSISRLAEKYSDKNVRKSEEKVVSSLPKMTPKEIQEKVSEIVNNSSFIQLSEDGKNYVNTKTGKLYDRVTNFITGGKEVKQTPLLKSASTIGNKTDVLTRDFFAGELKPLKSYGLSSEAEVTKYIGQLQELKNLMDSRNEIVLPEDIILYNDEIGVAGTVDLISYDNNGNFRIYDMKTMRGNQLETSYKGDVITKYDTKAYGQSNREKHQAQLSMYRILLNNTHGVLATDIEIIPIVVDYQPGDVSTKSLDKIDNIIHTPLDTVATASIAKEEVEEETKAPAPAKKKKSMTDIFGSGADNSFIDADMEGNSSKNPLNNDC